MITEFAGFYNKYIIYYQRIILNLRLDFRVVPEMEKRLTKALSIIIIVIQIIYRLENRMKVKVSPKFQIVIPRAVRKALTIKPGDDMEIIPYGNRFECVPVKNIREIRGLLCGMDTMMERDEDRVRLD